MVSVQTKIGQGYAIIFESGEQDNFWTVAMDNGAIVTFAQSDIKISRSYTHGRGITDKQMKKIISGR